MVNIKSLISCTTCSRIPLYVLFLLTAFIGVSCSQDPGEQHHERLETSRKALKYIQEENYDELKKLFVPEIANSTEWDGQQAQAQAAHRLMEKFGIPETGTEDTSSVVLPHQGVAQLGDLHYVHYNFDEDIPLSGEMKYSISFGFAEGYGSSHIFLIKVNE